MKKNSSIDTTWTRRSVVYQIYPRSFKDTNGDGVGDLEGIIEKLDYLNDGTENSLGIRAIWISPIYKSPMADFGYDISDYYTIDPVFGDLETFNRLVKEAHKRDIRVIMDFVANHTSIKHPWFKESRSSKHNPKRDWYIWKDPKPDGSAPNNWLSVLGGSTWTLDEKTQQYYMHSFLLEQPDLNWRNEKVKDAMEKIIEFWLHKGVDGFRSDATYHMIKDNQFRDEPPNPKYVPGRDDPYNALLHIYSQNQPETLDTVNGMCQLLGLHKDKYIISEAYLDIPEMSKLYRACNNGLHAPFNFNLISLPWSAKSYRLHIDQFEKALTKNDWPNYVLGNHDRPRVATRIGNKRARLAAMLLLTLRGMPFIYYGDELGMENVTIPPEKQKDLVKNRFLSRDGERTPMQWDSRQFAGFSDVEPWLPISDSYKEVNIEKQRKDPLSMFNLYRRLIQYRNRNPVLQQGSYRSFDPGDSHIFAFVREYEGVQIFVILNFSRNKEGISIPFKKARVIIDTYNQKDGQTINGNHCILDSYQGYIVQAVE